MSKKSRWKGMRLSAYYNENDPKWAAWLRELNLQRLMKNKDQRQIQSSHVILVPWCQCCEARVEIDHVCECERE